MCVDVDVDFMLFVRQFESIILLLIVISIQFITKFLFDSYKLCDASYKVDI